MKTIMKTTAIGLVAILALGLSGTAMAATDGTPGATSTGSFGVAITLQNAPASQVNILGLDDVDFGTVIKNADGTLNHGGERQMLFCLTRSDAGNVVLSLAQSTPKSTSSDTFTLEEGGGVDTDADGRIYRLWNTISLKGGPLNINSAILPSSPPVGVTPRVGCSTNPDPADYYFAITPESSTNAPALAYSANYVVTVTPQ